MAAYDFDFAGYVERKKNPGGVRGVGGEYGDYAFSGDIRVRRRLDTLKPVQVVVRSMVRLFKRARKNELLGSAVKISRRQFPELFDATAQCAAALDITMPTVYVTNNPTINAGTYGTDEESFIILNSALVDTFEPEEVLYIIGHECGHLHNNHVVYQTVLDFMRWGVGAYIKWAVTPASLALNSWSRRAEITCDRAGLICCKSEDAALTAMLKLAVGSKQLFEKADMDEFMAQLDDLQDGVGRFAEYFNTHPYIPKRLHALKMFAGSNYYRSYIGESGGEPLDEVDRNVEKLIQVL